MTDPLKLIFHRILEIYGKHNFKNTLLGLQESVSISYVKSGKDLKGIWLSFELKYENQLNTTKKHIEYRWVDKGWLLQNNMYVTSAKWEPTLFLQEFNFEEIYLILKVAEYFPPPDDIKSLIKSNNDCFHYIFFLLMLSPILVLLLMFGPSLIVGIIAHFIVLVNCTLAQEYLREASPRFRLFIKEMGIVFGGGSFVPAIMYWAGLNPLYYYLLCAGTVSLIWVDYLIPTRKKQTHKRLNNACNSESGSKLN